MKPVNQSLVDSIKSISDLIKQPNIVGLVFGSIKKRLGEFDFEKQLKRRGNFKIEIDEMFNHHHIDDYLYIFEKLNLLKVHWDKKIIDKMLRRRLEIVLNRTKFLNFYNIFNGLKNNVGLDTLKSLSKLISDLFTDEDDLMDFLLSCGVSKNFLVDISSQNIKNILLKTLITYSATNNKKDEKIFKKIIQKSTDIKLHNLDEVKVIDYKNKLKNILNSSGYEIGVLEEKMEFKNCVLFFKGKIVDFGNSPKQKDLLEVLFQNPKEKMFYDQIQEKLSPAFFRDDIALDDKYWTRFYTAGDEINKKVATETGIKNFIVKNTKEIRINPDYT